MELTMVAPIAATALSSSQVDRRFSGRPVDYRQATITFECDKSLRDPELGVVDENWLNGTVSIRFKSKEVCVDGPAPGPGPSPPVPGPPGPPGPKPDPPAGQGSNWSPEFIAVTAALSASGLVLIYLVTGYTYLGYRVARRSEAERDLHTTPRPHPRPTVLQ